jgi:hypothetical protein
MLCSVLYSTCGVTEANRIESSLTSLAASRLSKSERFWCRILVFMSRAAASRSQQKQQQYEVPRQQQHAARAAHLTKVSPASRQLIDTN